MRDDEGSRSKIDAGCGTFLLDALFNPSCHAYIYRSNKDLSTTSHYKTRPTLRVINGLGRHVQISLNQSLFRKETVSISSFQLLLRLFETLSQPQRLIVGQLEQRLPRCGRSEANDTRLSYTWRVSRVSMRLLVQPYRDHMSHARTPRSWVVHGHPLRAKGI